MLDKYKYSGYGMWFDSFSEFLFTVADGSMEKCAHLCKLITNINILISGEGPKQWLDYTTLTAEAKYPIAFTEPRKRFVLSLHYNGSNSSLFVTATKIY